MRLEFLTSAARPRIFLIASGFAHGPELFRPLLEGEVGRRLEALSCALAVAYDYTAPEDFDNAVLKDFSEIYLLAWSLGARMAGCILKGFSDKLVYAAAVNGTSLGIDREFGLDPRVYALTQKRMSAETLRAFLEKMLDPALSFEEYLKARGPLLSPDHYQDELKAIRECEALPINWDEAWISDSDAVFSPRIQKRAWENCGKRVEISEISHSFHYDPTAFSTIALKILSKNSGKAVERPQQSLVGKRFLKAAASYDENALVQRQLALKLAAALKPQIQIGARVLELGCGTGLFSRELARLPLGHLTLNDLTAEQLAIAASAVGMQAPKLKLSLLPGDMDELKFKGPFDLITANAALQWSHDLKALLARLKGALAQGGIIAFTTFVPGTFKELAACKVKGLAYLREEELLAIGQGLGFKVRMEPYEKVLGFPDGLSALRHLSLTGVTALNAVPSSPSKVRELIKALDAQASGRDVQLTFKGQLVLMTEI